MRIRDEKGELKILWDFEHFDRSFTQLIRDGWRQLGEFGPVVGWLEVHPRHFRTQRRPRGSPSTARSDQARLTVSAKPIAPRSS